MRFLLLRSISSRIYNNNTTTATTRAITSLGGISSSSINYDNKRKGYYHTTTPSYSVTTRIKDSATTRNATLQPSLLSFGYYNNNDNALKSNFFSTTTTTTTTEDSCTTTNNNSILQTSDKKLRSSRNRAAQMIPLWLKKEPEYFERTMEALNLTTSSNKKARRKRWEETQRQFNHSDLDNNDEDDDDNYDLFFNDNSNTSHENPNNTNNYLEWKYSKEFFGSIPSFMEDIVYNNNNDNNNNNNNLQTMLDELVQLGFGDEEFAKRYRWYEQYQSQLARNRHLIQMKQKQFHERKAILHQLYHEYRQLKNSDKKRRKRNQYQNIQQHERGMKTIQKQIQHFYQEQEQLVHELQEQQTKNSLWTFQQYQTLNQVVKDVLLNHDFCNVFADYIQKSHEQKIKQYQDLDAKTDLTKPQEWYLRARLLKRKIIFHGGPTNSGKTYTALKRLKEAKKGLYLGPLRLLAGEVYDTLTSEGIYTNLLTGQEKREIAFSTHSAATVEMFGAMSNDSELEFDVAVIDEIQMIQHSERGFAWTRALLGLQCKEIHVCGGFEAAEIVKQIAESCGDEFELHQYERFNELKVLPHSLASHPKQKNCYRNVQPGDCIVAFSRNDIFAIKREIEKQTNYKVCVIYGSLPPQTRKMQAQLFNDPNSGYDVLVASDAIGMGLNLNIKRIVFNSIFKHDGHDIVRLDHSSVKQISGRAGRYNSLYSSGEVTTRDPRDLQYLKECLQTEIAPIRNAGLIPTAAHIEMFHEALMVNNNSNNNNNNNTELRQDAQQKQQQPHLHNIIRQFSEIAILKGDYFLCRLTDIYIISKWLQHIPLSLEDKYTFCMAPVSMNSKYSRDLLVRFAEKFSAGEVSGLTRGTHPKRARSFAELSNLCSIHAELELFIWLQNKFPPCNFMEQQSALSRLEMTVAFIAIGLNETDRLHLDHCYIKQDNFYRSTWEKENESEEEDSDEEDENCDMSW